MGRGGGGSDAAAQKLEIINSNDESNRSTAGIFIEDLGIKNLRILSVKVLMPMGVP
jgi:hypothetical protein